MTTKRSMARRLRRMFVAALIVLPAGTSGIAANRPNVVMIAVDDLRPMLGCYGDTRIRTPNIDRLAARGIVFERAYCQYAKCGTSRLSLMTGLRPSAIGIYSNNARHVAAFRKRRPDAVSLARWFKDQGYETRSFGKIDHDGWSNPDDWSAPAVPGRDREMWEVVDEHLPGKPTRIADRFDCPVMQSPNVDDEHLFAGRMTRDVIQDLSSTELGKPFFFAVGYRRPHLPFVAPQRYFDLYDPDESWLPRNPLPSADAPVLAWFNSDGYIGSARRVGLTMPIPPTRQQAIDWNGYEMRSYTGVPNFGPIDVKLQLRLMQAYAACITYVDTQIGRLLDSLETLNQMDNTILLLWSDHGWHLGEHSAWSKLSNCEVATRVPLIVSAPGFEPKRIGSPVELVDIYPTLCDLTGLTSPQHIHGTTLRPLLSGLEPANEPVAFSDYVRYDGQYMGKAIRTRDFRFVVWTESASGKVIARELYDHKTDPLETNNLADEPVYADTVIKLERLQSETTETTDDL